MLSVFLDCVRYGRVATVLNRRLNSFHKATPERLTMIFDISSYTMAHEFSISAVKPVPRALRRVSIKAVPTREKCSGLAYLFTKGSQRGKHVFKFFVGTVVVVAADIWVLKSIPIGSGRFLAVFLRGEGSGSAACGRGTHKSIIL